MKYESTKEEMFDSIYRSYELEIYHAALYIAKDEVLAEEITQQAFVNFYERFDKINLTYAKTYLVHSVQNLLNNHFRDAKWEVQSEEDEEKPIIEPATESLEEKFFENRRKHMERQLGRVIFSEVKEKNESWFEILHMRFYMDKSYDEISEELGITKEVLYSRLHRAKNWIQKKYETKFEDITDMT